MGISGKKYIKEHFSWDVLSNDYVEFYKWVQNGGKHPFLLIYYKYENSYSRRNWRSWPYAL